MSEHFILVSFVKINLMYCSTRSGEGHQFECGISVEEAGHAGLCHNGLIPAGGLLHDPHHFPSNFRLSYAKAMATDQEEYRDERSHGAICCEAET